MKWLGGSATTCILPRDAVPPSSRGVRPLEGTVVGSVKLEDRETRLRSDQPSVQQFGKILDDFIENGLGTLEERQQALIDRLLEMDASYAEFLSKRN